MALHENDKTHAKKVDVIIHGIETIGSAERSCDKEAMRQTLHRVFAPSVMLGHIMIPIRHSDAAIPSQSTLAELTERVLSVRIATRSTVRSSHAF